MLRSHDLSCLSVVGCLPGSYGGRLGQDGFPNRWGSGARPSSLDVQKCLEAVFVLTRRSPRAGIFFQIRVIINDC